MGTIELKIPSETGYEKLAMSSPSNPRDIMGFSDSRVEDVKTAVSEACINAIEHGNASDVTTKVFVTMTMDDDRLAIDVARRRPVGATTDGGTGTRPGGAVRRVRTPRRDGSLRHQGPGRRG